MCGFPLSSNYESVQGMKFSNCILMLVSHFNYIYTYCVVMIQEIKGVMAKIIFKVQISVIADLRLYQN